MKSKDKFITQVLLSCPIDDNESLHMVTWLDEDSRIKKGVKLTLKDDDRLWTVTEVYNTELSHTVDNRGWDNNNYDKHNGIPMKDR